MGWVCNLFIRSQYVVCDVKCFLVCLGVSNSFVSLTHPRKLANILVVHPFLGIDNITYRVVESVVIDSVYCDKSHCILTFLGLVP